MNDTVAVALITSVSTLTAAGLTGVVSARVTGRQLRHQRELAREERAEQRAAAHRDLCREACERFLAEADRAYRTLDAAWTAAPGAAPDAEAGFAARRAVDEAFVRLQVAGPDAVAARGAEVVAAIGEEFRRVARGEPSGRTDALRSRAAVTDAFARTARHVLAPAPGHASPALEG
ncbi:hypothetical protein RM572_27190 [Streptomyces sp. DSM 42041]|uniref:Uncharacterized protein n=1 Tax=Streptomyces hazeniae TaxID=3075538 RepID=A0ABU2P1X8_9ACTN|nr:hypothetical protein [Streptomyces sp. DSM 42041]MDT0382448.1 hypothetical protein [Streptomyces sp. DSM 42041]